MKNEEYKIHIIGAGVSGLVAAKVLENQGFHPVIIDATDRVGGRVKTDIIEGYQLDHGFQVLLTAYPAAQKYLDFKSLELQHFLPGSAIFKNNKQVLIGDPLREKSLLFPTLFSGIGNLSDKFKILALNKKLKAKSIEDIFETKEQTTLGYLKDFGFSEDMTNTFFKPFFSGIFLEEELRTSSRMFEFIYKMFGNGFAALPKGGIEAIPQQLAKGLKNTTFKFNTKVANVSDQEIILENGEKLESHFTIIAADASPLISNLKNQSTTWKSCDTLYFETDKKEIDKSLIGLVADDNSLINNIFYHTSLATKSRGQKELLSVTVVKDNQLKAEELVKQVTGELNKYCGISDAKFLKHYKIPMALPDLNQVSYKVEPTETRLTTSIFLAGDTLLNGSLNAAMLSGEAAALGLIETLTGNAS